MESDWADLQKVLVAETGTSDEQQDFLTNTQMDILNFIEQTRADFPGFENSYSNGPEIKVIHAE